jgi:nucleoside-diphosphate-sugar epimerase
MSPKTALITGSHGFIGRHMVKELVARGYRCQSWDLPTDDAVIHFTAAGGTLQVFDLVVHCAYHVGGRKGIDGNRSSLAKNLALDATLFDWAVRTKQQHVLYFSSSAVYPVELQIQPGRRLREDDGGPDHSEQSGPDADYGWAKLIGERTARNAIELGVPVTVVRPFSGYGKDQSEDYPFRAFLERAMRREDPFVIWGNANQARDWIHVDDVVNSALAVVDHDHEMWQQGRAVPTTVNLCTGRATSMQELAAEICRTAGYEPQYQVDREAPMGVFYRVGDPSKMECYFTPTITLEEGIRRAFQ